MKLGLNLSFAVKRWLDPVELAKMIKEDFGVDHVQFTWDLIDPWWPQAQRDVMVYQYKDAFADAGITIDATFGGLASYSYAHLLAPTKVQRDIAFTFFKRLNSHSNEARRKIAKPTIKDTLIIFQI